MWDRKIGLVYTCNRGVKALFSIDEFLQCCVLLSILIAFQPARFDSPCWSIRLCCHPTRYPAISQDDMGREDQIEEREVLDSIFPDEITG